MQDDFDRALKALRELGQISSNQKVTESTMRDSDPGAWQEDFDRWLKECCVHRDGRCGFTVARFRVVSYLKHPHKSGAREYHTTLARLHA
jgi:hypothetical protein